MSLSRAIFSAVVAFTLFCSTQKKTVTVQEVRGNNEQEDNTKPVSLTGRYFNETYGFSVLIPEGFTGLMNPAPFPNHGFCISLTPTLEANISIDSSYDVFFWTSLEEALSKEIGFVKPKGAEALAVEHSFTHLNNLKAIRAIVKYKTQATNEIRLQEIIVALRKSNKEGVVYTVLLETSEPRYLQDSKTLAQLLQTWKYHPMP